MTNAIIICSMSAMGVMATFFVLDKKYEDGLIGRFALVAMIISAFLLSALTFEHLVSEERDWAEFVSPKMLIAVFMVAATVFMGRHMYRYLMWRCFGEGDWRGRGK